VTTTIDEGAPQEGAIEGASSEEDVSSEPHEIVAPRQGARIPDDGSTTGHYPSVVMPVSAPVEVEDVLAIDPEHPGSFRIAGNRRRRHRSRPGDRAAADGSGQDPRCRRATLNGLQRQVNSATTSPTAHGCREGTLKCEMPRSDQPHRRSPGPLDGEALAYLETRSVELGFREGETIFRQGDPGDALWVVLQGEVDIRRRSVTGEHVTLAQVGPGGTFGELAILRSTQAVADAVSVTPVTVLRFPGEQLANALAECEPLRRALFTRLADDLYRTATGAVEFYGQTRALAGMGQGGVSPDRMVAVSAPMRRVKKRLLGLATDRCPVLLRGEAGTGKLLAARVIHAASDRGDGPLIVVDCRRIATLDTSEFMFGDRSDDEDDAEHFGALHLAHGGTLVLRGVDRLDAVSQRKLTDHLQAEREVDTVPFPDVRIIATVEGDHAGREDDQLTSDLGPQFDAVVDFPPLRERRRDILPLAREFLDTPSSSRTLVLAPSAEQALVALNYRHRNVAELRSVVKLAARVADGGEIRAEHVFTGFDEERPVGLNLSQFWFVRWMVSRGGVGLARFSVAAGYFAITGLCLVAGASAIGKLANGVVWSVWEPVVFGLFLLVGSVWCTVCPLSSSGRAVQRLVTLNRPPPAWVLRAGGWLSAAGFVAILWAEEVFRMTAVPLASGILLVALVLSAVVCCVLWQREVWCRQLCPLGRLGVALAPVAPTTVAARPSLCASTCTTHDCYKGNEREPGCPVYHHPQLVSEAHNCKTCLTCLRSCPHGSTGYYLRPRLRSAWRLVSAESYVVPMALTVFLLSPVLILAQRGGRVSEPMWLTLFCVATLAGAWILGRIMSPLLQGGEAPGSAMTARVSCALLVLGWGVLMAYQMDHLPLLHSLSIVAEQGSVWAVWPGPELTAAVLARVGFVVFGAILSATILWNTRGMAVHAGEPVNWFGWWLLISGCTVYTFGSLWLVT
jgi:polyferredoxin